MKRIIFLLSLCLSSISPALAQYHITGDTVQFLDSIWWRPQWFNNFIDSMPPHGLNQLTSEAGGAERLMRHVTDRPIRVIGIAASVQLTDPISPALEVDDTMTAAQEYFLIYKNRRDGNETPLRSVAFDPTAPHRYIEGARRKTTPPNCDTVVMGWSQIRRMCEVYFENPLVLTDTFYIGMSHYSDTLGGNVVASRLYGTMAEAPCGAFPFYLTEVFTMYHDWPTVPAGKPTEQQTLYFWYIFPILSQDTDFSLLDSCPAAGRMWIDTSDGGSVLRWEADSLHTQWQLGIADTGAASPWLDTTLTEPFLDLAAAGIAPPFSVQVRPHCLCYEYYEVWGDWGDCTVFLPEPCNPVSNLQYLPSGHGRGTLAWTSDTMHTLWQVTLGYTGTAPEEAWIDTLVAVPFLAIDSLGLTSAFTAHVRANCGGDNWSEWSEGFHADPFSDTTGIAQPTPVTSRLLPNPADGLVRAVSDGRLLSVEAYDLAGRRMLSLTSSGREASFDVSSWPAATYIVILRTPQGSTIHRLAVK